MLMAINRWERNMRQLTQQKFLHSNIAFPTPVVVPAEQEIRNKVDDTVTKIIKMTVGSTCWREFPILTHVPSHHQKSQVFTMRQEKKVDFVIVKIHFISFGPDVITILVVVVCCHCGCSG